MTMIPRPPGQEFQAGYLPEWVFWPQEGQPPQPEPPPSGGMMPALGAPTPPLFKAERGSSPAETASFYGQTASSGNTGPAPFHGVTPGWATAEPGMMSFLGMSTGTGVDDMGYMHDAAVFDAGAAAGGLLMAPFGPLASAAGGLLGRQADLNYALADMGRMNRGGINLNAWDVLRDRANFSSGEVRAAREYADRVRAGQQAVKSWSPEKTAAVNAALAKVMAGNSAFGNSGSQTKASETTGSRALSGSSVGAGRQTVSGASRNSSFNGRSFGDRGRSI